MGVWWALPGNALPVRKPRSHHASIAASTPSMPRTPNRIRKATGIPWGTLRATLIVSLGGFLFGFDASVISGVIGFIGPEFQLGELQTGWVVSSPSFTAMFAMIVAGRMGDRVGRKPTLVVIALLYGASALLSALAPGFMWLVAARMLGGVAFGAALILAPLYIAEISPPAWRGRLVSVQQLNIVLGFSAAYFSNFILVKTLLPAGAAALEGTGGAGAGGVEIWRWMLAVEMAPALLFLGLLTGVPESPRWLRLMGRHEQVRRSALRLGQREQDLLGALDGGRPPLDAPLADWWGKEVSLVERLRELASGRYRKVFIMALLLGISQQLTGINAVFFYAPVIFARTGFGLDASLAQAVVVGIVNVVFTVLAIGLIDRIGRRPLLLWGLVGIVASMSLTAAGFDRATYEISSAQLSALEAPAAARLADLEGRVFDGDLAFREALEQRLPPREYRLLADTLLTGAIRLPSGLVLAGILGFVASFAFSLGPVMWVVLSELFPVRLRGAAVSIVGFGNSLMSWLVQLLFPIELTLLGNSTTYLLYAGFAVAALLYFARVLPETKGKSLEEIQAAI